MDNTFQYYEDDHCEILIFEKYLIKQVKEGQTIIPAHAKELKVVIDKYYGDNPFIYISNRTFSYSVDPLTYKAAAVMENLKGIAIVTNEDKIKQASFESTFFEKPFAIFEDLTKAIAWVDQILDKKYVTDQPNNN